MSTQNDSDEAFQSTEDNPFPGMKISLWCLPVSSLCKKLISDVPRIAQVDRLNQMGKYWFCHIIRNAHVFRVLTFPANWERIICQRGFAVECKMVLKPNKGGDRSKTHTHLTWHAGWGTTETENWNKFDLFVRKRGPFQQSQTLRGRSSEFISKRKTHFIKEANQHSHDR